MMTTNLFVIANIKQLRASGSFRILLLFCWTSWGVGVLNSAIFKSFHNQIEFGTILEGLRNFGGEGGLNPPPQTLPLSTALVGIAHSVRFLLCVRHIAGHKWRYVFWLPEQVHSSILIQIEHCFAVLVKKNYQHFRNRREIAFVSILHLF